MNCCSVLLGGEESTIGSAGETILPPTVTESGGTDPDDDAFGVAIVASKVLLDSL